MLSNSLPSIPNLLSSPLSNQYLLDADADYDHEWYGDQGEAQQYYDGPYYYNDMEASN